MTTSPSPEYVATMATPCPNCGGPTIPPTPGNPAEEGYYCEADGCAYSTPTSTTTPYLWVRHATQERAERAAATIATRHPALVVYVAPDATVAEYPYAVRSVA